MGEDGIDRDELRMPMLVNEYVQWQNGRQDGWYVGRVGTFSAAGTTLVRAYLGYLGWSMACLYNVNR